VLEPIADCIGDDRIGFGELVAVAQIRAAGARERVRLPARKKMVQVRAEYLNAGWIMPLFSFNKPQ
jgi:hypothetical protein